MNPDRVWGMLQMLTQSTGDTIDLSKIPEQARGWMKSLAERTGTQPLPESGVWTKQILADFMSKQEAIRAASSSNGGQGGWGQGGWGQGGWGQNGPQPFERKEAEEERPVAMRYGKLPKDLPSWFERDDIDKDGQISLYEWRKAEKSIEDFDKIDLNKDGFITADEYLRFTQQQKIQVKLDAYEAGERSTGGWNLGTVTGPAPSEGTTRPGGWGTKGTGGGGPGSGGPGGWGGKGTGGGGDPSGGKDKDKSGKDKGGPGGPGSWRTKG
ncbi:MAG: hypothetical protein K2V38_03885 [Gemmataceae bacterium]|nr:hypothetical protein [Gemmataceae bacterium]